MSLSELLNQKSSLKKTIVLLKIKGDIKEMNRQVEELESIEYQIRKSQ